MALPAVDSFSSPDGFGLNLTNWVEFFGAFIIFSGRAKSFASEGIAGWQLDAFNDDQYAQGVVVCPTDAAGVVCIRMVAAGGSATHYGLQIYSPGGVTTIQLYKFIGGSYTVLQTFTEPWTDGNTVRVEASAGSLASKMNSGSGFAVLSGSPTADASLASGTAGMRSYAGAFLDDFQADNMAGPAPRYLLVRN